MNYLPNIEIESHASEWYVNLLTNGETSGIAFEIIDGAIMVNMNEFQQFCEREDVSLSPIERETLLSRIETEIADTAASVEVEEIGDGFFEAADGTVIFEA